MGFHKLSMIKECQFYKINWTNEVHHIEMSIPTLTGYVLSRLLTLYGANKGGNCKYMKIRS